MRAAGVFLHVRQPRRAFVSLNRKNKKKE